jgi:hypothetical protein
MRIISGKYKGRRIFPPKNLPVRPTTDMSKEALFNVLNNHFSFEGLKILDLFSGTGNISFEFASRGSSPITSVDGDFGCHDNHLVDVSGFPLIIGGRISITDNPVEEIFKLFPPDRWSEVPEFLNEYNVIREGKKVILQALEVVYDELVLEVPENIEIKAYEII